ncbi:MAG: hypothetical protein P4L51_03310 [Puia sp.]|nr:hypothetical protein [Puia sp.]
MNIPSQKPVSDEQARRLAKGFVALFTAPLKVMGKRGFESPVTIADSIRLGGVFIAAFNVATVDPTRKEKTEAFAQKIAEFIYQPEEMEEFLFTRIKERLENEQEIIEAISQVELELSGPGAFRRFVKKAMAEAMPKGRQGRPTTFDAETDPERFLALSSELIYLCDRFLLLREQFPAKSNKSIMNFLESEDAKGEAILRKHERFITETMGEFDFRVLLKAHTTKVQRLADAIAGRELLNWSFTYSVQKAGEFRRARGIEPKE